MVIFNDQDAIVPIHRCGPECDRPLGSGPGVILMTPLKAHELNAKVTTVKLRNYRGRRQHGRQAQARRPPASGD